MAASKKRKRRDFFSSIALVLLVVCIFAEVIVFRRILFQTMYTTVFSMGVFPALLYMVYITYRDSK